MSDNNELILKTFVPGTKAKADEVNSNFSILKNAIISKADKEGNQLQPFFVGDAVDDLHAMNKGQVKVMQDELDKKIQKMSSFFCVKSGNITDGNADLFGFSELTLTLKAGGIYPNLVCSNYEGVTYTIDSSSDLSLVGKANGVYNIFVNSEGVLYVKNNTIYVQKSVPQMLEEDIWLDTSVEPIVCKKYLNQEYVDFYDVPLGRVYIENAAISKVETFSYNQNGYALNMNSIGNFYYNYSAPIGLAANTTHTFGSSGLLYIYSNDYLTNATVYLDGYPYGFNYIANIQSMSAITFPVSKGQACYVVTQYSSTILFVPLEFRKNEV